MALERSISFTIETTLFDNDAHMAVNDFLIAGLGQCKIEMDTEIEMVPVLNPVTQEPILDEKGQPREQAQILSQEIHLRHFHHSQFRWEPCKDWRLCNWVAFDHYMTRDDIEDQFNVDIKDKGGGTEDASEVDIRLPRMDKYENVYTVHEVWDKRTKKRIWVSECYQDVLRPFPTWFPSIRIRLSSARKRGGFLEGRR